MCKHLKRPEADIGVFPQSFFYTTFETEFLGMQFWLNWLASKPRLP